MRANNLDHIKPQQYKKEIGFLFNHLKRRKPKEILKNIRSRGLDVGAGCGQYTEVLNGSGCEVYALDCNEEMIRDANCLKVIGRGESLPFKDGKFDFSFAINVLHHTDNPVDIVLEMARVSRRIIIGELNKDNWFVRQYVKFRLPFDSWELHLNEGEFKELIESVKLTMVNFYTKSLFGIPKVFMWAVCEC